MKRIVGGLLLSTTLLGAPAWAAPVTGWLSWRGPDQTGVTRETGLPTRIQSAEDALWVADWGGGSTATLANGHLYIMGFQGTGADLQEGLACLDPETGKILWTRAFNDFLSDTIYLRYATASPAIDPATGHIFMQGTQGIFAAFDPDGKVLWQHSLMEELGRMTFPNGRTASPLVDGDLVITRGITSNWGAQGAPSDRFYAYDMKTGDLVWSSTPAGRPHDNSYSHPYLTWYKGQRVMIAACGDGSVVCVNTRTGDPIWRVQLAGAGINATVVVHHNDKVIVIYGIPYEEPGQLMAFRIPDVDVHAGKPGPVVVDRASVELWSNPDISSSTSSPILAGDRVYATRPTGDLVAVDANTGKVFWTFKLGTEQRNSSPLAAGDVLYAPILDDPAAKGEGNTGEASARGGFYVLKDKGGSVETLSHVSLVGRCMGSPVAYNGKVYIQTSAKVYAFGKAGANPGLPKPVAETPWPKAGAAKELQIIPSEVLLSPGGKTTFRARKLDSNGLAVADVQDPGQLHWSAYVPPTALVKAHMEAAFNNRGELVAPADAKLSAGAFQADLDGLKGLIRGRVMPHLPIQENFEEFTLNSTTTNSVEPPTAFAYPPLPWIGARFRFEVRDVDGSKALTKTIDNRLLQRSTAFIGEPSMKNYTVQADVRSEGRARKMSEVGIINQRYVIVLKGNSQELEVNSNQERLRVAKPFRWKPNVWYTVKARVDVAPDGSGVVHARAWPRGEPEPGTWTIEVPHKTAHNEGSPGLYAFSPQNMRVYVDNIQVTAN